MEKIREAVQLTAGTVEKLATKRAITNIRLPRINQFKIVITPPCCETGTLN